jgi:formate dehydrogenase maturation protein FdhE
MDVETDMPSLLQQALKYCQSHPTQGRIPVDGCKPEVYTNIQTTTKNQQLQKKIYQSDYLLILAKLFHIQQSIFEGHGTIQQTNNPDKIIMAGTLVPQETESYTTTGY